MDEKLKKITIDFLEMLNGMNLEDIEQIKAEWLNELADKKSKFKDYEEGADKILDYYRASKGAFLCIQKNKRILHYGYIIKQSL